MLVDPVNTLRHLFREPLDEVLDQDRNILAPFSQRGHHDRKHVQPIEEIRSKRPRRDRFGQISVRRGDHPDVHRDGAAPANPLNLTLLQHAQQRNLRVHRDLANLVEKNGARVREFETAAALLHRSSERAFLVPEQLRRDE